MIEEVVYVTLFGCAINAAFTVVTRCHKSVKVAYGLGRRHLCGMGGEDRDELECALTRYGGAIIIMTDSRKYLEFWT